MYSYLLWVFTVYIWLNRNYFPEYHHPCGSRLELNNNWYEIWKTEVKQQPLSSEANGG